MFQTLLSPLRSRFDLSPRSPTTSSPSERLTISPTNPDDDLNPEEFARDVLVELMRNSVEKLKQADDLRNKSETLSEIQRIMLQDACTRDVFREMDGFLYLMSVLSTIQDRPSGVAIVEPEIQVVQETIECTRWVFLIFSEAMKNHHANTEYFRNRVGYESLTHALRGLVAERRTVLETMGFLLSLSLCDFSLANFFSSLRNVPWDTIDSKIAEFKLGTIKYPEALMILWNLALPQLTGVSSNLDEDDPIRYALFKLFELLFHVNHRNHAILCSLGLIKSVFAQFSETRKDPDALEKERHVLQKLLRRLLEMGATTTEARRIFQKAVVLKEADGKNDGILDGEIMDVVRFGIKSRWVEHFSMETPAAIVVRDDKFKGLPATGFTYMMWFWLSDLPSGEGSHCLFAVDMPLRVLLKLSLRTDGKLELVSSSNEKPAVFTTSSIRKARWTHIALVHYPHRGSNPNIRLYVDGVFAEGLSWAFPRPEAGFSIGKYTIGDSSNKTEMSWCLASSYLLSTPLSDELPRLIHHLGPRYTGIFQDPHMVKFLTYEASTSLNMFLAVKNTVPLQKSKPGDQTSIVKALKGGMGIPEASVIFSFSAAGAPGWGQDNGVGVRCGIGALNGDVEGDVFTVKAECLDVALWKIGGAAVVLRLVQLATTPHEISRALGILTDGLRNSWQNSEDMERLRGYEILADILRSKAQSINLTAFEILFEFLGMSFGTPEQSTIVNVVAYRVIALDFSLWSRARKEIQRTHLEHFTILLQTSKYKSFNMKQRLSSMGLVRKLLFALQADWYSQDTLVHLLEALNVVAKANFDKDDTIKPMVSYLAANLTETLSVSSGDHSPRSIISRFEFNNPKEKAEQVLLILANILPSRPYYLKFTSALPITRICLLLLGERPSPFVATQILNLIGLSIQMSSSFNRKFELVSGWSVLKTVLPPVWDPQVNKAAFDLLLGRCSVDIGPATPTPSSASSSKSRSKSKQPKPPSTTVSCTYILPIIISALQTGLITASNHSQVADNDEASNPPTRSTETAMENLIEEFLTLHATSSTFRQIFESYQTTQLFIDTYKSLVDKLSSASSISDWNARILEKLTHFGLALALDNAVGGGQKREILDQIQSAENMLDPSAKTTMIDPCLVVDNRSVRQRIASARFSLQVGERNVVKTITRTSEWRKTVQVSERKRLRKTVLDLREYRRQVSRMQEWTYLLTSERGLWPRHESFLWRLDETEGPHRIRKKLEPQNENSPSSRVDALDEVIRDVRPPEVETPGIQIEVPPWAESYEISATDMDDNQQLAEEIVDDKLRRVRHELEPGDVIEAVATVARIDGVDSSPGLLILGRTHIYMLDGIVENEEGEVIDAHDAPKRLLFIPGSIVELDGPQRARRWAHNQIVTYSDKRFLFRDVALEIYFRDSRSLLVVFLDKKRRSDFEQHFPSIMGRLVSELVMSPGAGSQTQRSPLRRMSSRMMSGFRSDELSAATRKWQARELSNFAYLSILNQISGRTRSDATQYPVFPWVLSDYTSSILDLNSSDSYRDLTKPMGALTPARCRAADTRYTNLESVGEEPFHYGTHFSSSMIVCHFLIRLAPFTNMFKTLQGGDWDLPDRLFSDLPRAYDSAAQDVRGDVRELIPEFFTCPEFLENSSNHDFGIMQHTGERIHDVKLPPWARQDPLLFIVLNRRALESPHVSEHLPAWIDLIWGCNQRDAASLNAFHPLSYEGSIDLDSIQDDLEREATVGIIHNFGQTPRKLFTSPHPERYHHGLYSLPLGTLHGIEEDPHLLAQGPRCFKDLGPTVPVRELVLDTLGDKMIPCPEGMLCVPQYPHESVEWRPGSAELRVVVDHKVVQVVEYAFCTCAVFADASSLITGSSDYTVRLWKVIRGPNPNSSSSAMRVSLSHIMRVHTDEVTCVTASRPWSLVVSGSKDGSAALWDLNRGVYVRSIWHGEGGESTAVDLVAINESTGYIATCSRLKLCLHTINGRPIAMLDLTKTSSFSALVPTITSIAFHEREYSHLGVLATGGPDGSITLRTWTADGTPEGEKAQWEFLTIRTIKVRMLGQSRPPSVTALKFLGESLYHGEETGKSFVWSLPDN